MAVDHAETQRISGGCALIRDDFQRRADCGRIAQASAGADARGEVGAQGNGIAVEAEHERHRQRLRRPAAPQSRGDRQRCDHVRGIAVAIEQPVEHGRPADIAHQPQRQALFLGETVFQSQDRQAGIHQGQEADGHFQCHHLPPSNLCAVTMASAISAMRRPWFIAVLRISA